MSISIPVIRVHKTGHGETTSILPEERMSEHHPTDISNVRKSPCIKWSTLTIGCTFCAPYTVQFLPNWQLGSMASIRCNPFQVLEARCNFRSAGFPLCSTYWEVSGWKQVVQNLESLTVLILELPNQWLVLKLGTGPPGVRDKERNEASYTARPLFPTVKVIQVCLECSSHTRCRSSALLSSCSHTTPVLPVLLWASLECKPI